MDTAYTDKVDIFVFVPDDEEGALKKEIKEGTNGQAVMEIVEECGHSREESGGK